MISNKNQLKLIISQVKMSSLESNALLVNELDIYDNMRKVGSSDQ